MDNPHPKLIFVAIMQTMRKMKEKKELPKNEAGQTINETFNREDFTNRLKLENKVLNKVLEKIKRIKNDDIHKQ